MADPIPNTQHLSEICILLVKHIYGELPSHIFSVLLDHHELPLFQLVQHAQLPPRHVQLGLAMLIQQNLLLFHPRDQSSATLYMPNWKQAYDLVRIGKHIEIVRQRFGAQVAHIISNASYLGSGTEDELVAKSDSTLGPKIIKSKPIQPKQAKRREPKQVEAGTDEVDEKSEQAQVAHEEDAAGMPSTGSSDSRANKGGPRTGQSLLKGSEDTAADVEPACTTDGARNDVEEAPGELISDTRASMAKLRSLGMLERVGDFTFMSDLDFTNVVQAHVRRTMREFRDSVAGRKKSVKFLELVNKKKREFVDHNETLNNILTDFDDQDRGSGQASKLRKPTKESDAANGPANAPDEAAAAAAEIVNGADGNKRKEAKLPVKKGPTSRYPATDTREFLRLNVDKFLVSHRSELLVDYARTRVGENFAKVYASFLHVLEPQIPWCRDQKFSAKRKRRDDSDDEESDEEYIDLEEAEANTLDWPTSTQILNGLDADTLEAMRQEIYIIYNGNDGDEIPKPKMAKNKDLPTKPAPTKRTKMADPEQVVTDTGKTDMEKADRADAQTRLAEEVTLDNGGADATTTKEGKPSEKKANKIKAGPKQIEKKPGKRKQAKTEKADREATEHEETGQANDENNATTSKFQTGKGKSEKPKPAAPVDQLNKQSPGGKRKAVEDSPNQPPRKSTRKVNGHVDGASGKDMGFDGTADDREENVDAEQAENTTLPDDKSKSSEVVTGAAVINGRTAAEDSKVKGKRKAKVTNAGGSGDDQDDLEEPADDRAPPALEKTEKPLLDTEESDEDGPPITRKRKAKEIASEEASRETTPPKKQKQKSKATVHEETANDKASATKQKSKASNAPKPNDKSKNQTPAKATAKTKTTNKPDNKPNGTSKPQPSIDIPSDAEDDSDHPSDDDDTLPPNMTDLQLVIRYLDILAADPSNLLIPYAHRASHQYTIDFETLLQKIAQSELERTVQSRFGYHAARVLRLLTLNDQKWTEQQLCDRALVSAADLRPVLARMQAAGFVEVQEVPKDPSRKPGTIVYLFYHNPDRCRRFLIDDAYMAMSRLLVRLEGEKAKVARELEIVGRSDFKEKMLRPAQREALEVWREREDAVLLQLARLDDVVMLWRDFVSPSTDTGMVRG